MSRRRRNQHDPLQVVNEPRSLVLRNQLSQIEWHVPLPPQADLKAALEAGRQRLIDEGCTMDEMKWYAFVFGRRGGERISLVIKPFPRDHPRSATAHTCAATRQGGSPYMPALRRGDRNERCVLGATMWQTKPLSLPDGNHK